MYKIDICHLLKTEATQESKEATPKCPVYSPTVAISLFFWYWKWAANMYIENLLFIYSKVINAREKEKNDRKIFKPKNGPEQISYEIIVTIQLKIS